MSIVIRCPSCSKEFTVDPSKAGTQLDCPKCNTLLIVPTPAPPEPGKEVQSKELEERKDAARCQVVKSSDPPMFNDPVAEQTNWKPAKDSGDLIRTFRLKIQDDGKAVFKKSTGMMILWATFIFIGIAILVAGYWGLGIKPSYEGMKHSFNLHGLSPLVPILFGFGFIIGGANMLISTKSPVFDRRSDCFYIGKNPGLRHMKHEGGASDQAEEKFCRLSEIHALQIIEEHCSTGGENSREFYSYELNLVLHDASRCFTMLHDASRCFTMLRVSMWWIKLAIKNYAKTPRNWQCSWGCRFGMRVGWIGPKPQFT